MTVFTHTLVTLFFVRLFNLSGREEVLAWLFGVAIDLDHLIRLPLYLKLHKFKIIKNFPWRTPLQEPISLLWITPLSIYLQSWVPVVFFLFHLALDYSMNYTKRPFYPFSNFEIKGQPPRVFETKKSFHQPAVNFFYKLLKLNLQPLEIVTFLIFLCLNLFLLLAYET